MGVPSGLGGQFVCATEATWGTIVTPDHSIEIDDESLTYDPTWYESAPVKAGLLGKPAARAFISRFGAKGDVKGDFSYNKMNALLQAAFGTAVTPTQIATSGIYKSVHKIGDPTGKSLTLQLGRPQASDGTVKPFTYPGAVLTDLEVSCQDGESLKWTATFDAKDEQTGTALAVASYVTGSGIFTFRDANVFKIGGTPSTTAGVTSIASGVTVASIVKGFNIKLSWGRAIDRFGIGNAGAKAQQIINAHPTVTGSLQAEFGVQSEFYDVFKAQTTTALQITFNGAVLSTSNYAVDLVLPACKLKMVDPDLSGPDIVQQQVDFEAYNNGLDNQYQLTYQTSDPTV